MHDDDRREIQIQQEEMLPAKGPFVRLPPNANMGEVPSYMIIKRWEEAPEGYYVPDITFVDLYYDQLYDEATSGIGMWAIVAFNGGNFRGMGYANSPVCEGQCENDPMYDVMENPDISDVLLVHAEAGLPDPVLATAPMDPPAPPSVLATASPDSCPTMVDPECEHWGYDCECIRKPAVDPFTHKPVFPLSSYPNYQFFHRDVYNYNLYSEAIGGLNVIPDGRFGYWINLDQPGLWCYFDWEMYRFGVILRNEQTGGYENWEPIAGVNELSDDGEYFYRYIF